MNWFTVIAVLPILALINCGPAELEQGHNSVSAKQDKEEVMPVPKPIAVRCTKSIPPVCFDADGKRID